VRMLAWCPATEEQGFAGSEAPRPTGRRPILSQRRGARRRKNKALRGAKHHAQPAEDPFCPEGVVPVDERIRRCGERSTTSNPPKSDFAPKTWCPSTKEQDFADNIIPILKEDIMTFKKEADFEEELIHLLTSVSGWKKDSCGWETPMVHMNRCFVIPRKRTF